MYNGRTKKICYNKNSGAVAHLAGALQFVDGAFPLISAGVYGYPQRDAIRVAIEIMKKQAADFEEITLVLFGEREFGVVGEDYPEFAEK